MKTILHHLKTATLSLIKKLIRLYQIAISPLSPPSCRYTPNCSEYAIQALEIHGLVHGSALAAKRLCRCHPWSRHPIYDPVPPCSHHQDREE
ncbi:MAG TPA: membrane protein insertion efficiency factor YidD [Gammaproteobacteria bacterium]|nr:membrane protein insertion efficiency factor YidD [Gammaproteobacteria bacterium]HBF08295.1 membrane protein insertion efficiency factor YidD [Gammaproteobacteria bacterium]HCK93126.1 membrane protein insertion efficiency factor YidD [Gammaproteobacteria bacterium]